MRRFTMTSDEFRERRKRLWPRQKDAAAALGVTPSLISHIEKGRRAVPRYVEIIMKFWEASGGK